jgi:hypothetical protein
LRNLSLGFKIGLCIGILSVILIASTLALPGISSVARPLLYLNGIPLQLADLVVADLLPALGLTLAGDLPFLFFFAVFAVAIPTVVGAGCSMLWTQVNNRTMKIVVVVLIVLVYMVVSAALISQGFGPMRGV